MSKEPQGYWTNKVEHEFMEKLSTTKAGDYLTYHRGPHCGGPLKHLVNRLFEGGVVVPVAKKHGPFDYEYMVAKTNRRKK